MPAKAKAPRPKSQAWRGGVVAEVAKRRSTALGRSHPASVEKRAEDRMRVRLEAPWDIAVGERVIVDSAYETLAADVYAVHPFNLVDVRLLAPLDKGTRRVHLRRCAL